MPDWDTLPKLDSAPTNPASPPRKRKPKVLILVVWLVLLGGLFGWISTHNPGGSGTGGVDKPPPPPPGPDPAKLQAAWSQIQAHAAAPPRGPANAPYTVIEFGDFQCPPCGKTRPKIEAMLAKYPTETNLMFLNLPLAIHHWAADAAQAAQFAASKGKFWQMYDMLYQNQDNLEPGFYGDYATKIGLDKQQMQTAISSKQYQGTVSDDVKFAYSLGIDSTPTVLCRDNRTGKIQLIPYGHGGDTVSKFLANPPWAAQTKTAAKS